MELEERPHSKYMANLMCARDTAHAIINNNPKWVITDIHPKSMGNYNPAAAKTQAEHCTQMTQNPKDHTKAGLSHAGNVQNSHLDTAKEVVMGCPKVAVCNMCHCTWEAPAPLAAHWCVDHTCVPSTPDFSLEDFDMSDYVSSSP